MAKKKTKTIDQTVEIVNQDVVKGELMLEEEKKPARKRYSPASLKKLEETEDGREAIARVVSNALYFFNKGKDAVKTDDELEERIEWYFSQCVSCNIIPTVEGMCNAIGIPRQTLWDWQVKNTRGLGPRTSDILKKAKEVLAQVDAELSMDGKIDRVVYLFRSKNYYGLVDKQEHVLTPNSPLDHTSDRAVLEAKYDELPED